MKIVRALISLSDKIGLLPFARALTQELGVEILSTGGTARALREAGVPVTEVADYTGFPEVFSGRVKTLHPRIHGGLLHLRDDPEHQRQARENDIQPIDLVVVNLYPFKETVARPGVTLDEAIEQIDIGGPSMLRSAAKNHRSVTVVTDPADYDAVLAAMRTHGGETTLDLRERLAVKTFIATAAYDHAIAGFLNREQQSGGSYDLSLPLVSHLRYGENSHQEASLYGNFDEFFQKLHGKELSFNNILDISAAAQLVGEFEEPSVAILKHTNPCGVGSDPDLREAWDKAFCHGQAGPVRRDHHLQPAADRGAGARRERDLQRGHHRAGFRAGRARAAPAQEEPAVDPAVAGRGHGRRGGGHSLGGRGACWCRSATGRCSGRSATRSSPNGSRPRRSCGRCCSAGGWSSMSRATPSCSRARTGRWASARDRCRGWTRRASRCGRRGMPSSGWKAASWPATRFFPFPDGLVAAAEAGATAAIQPGGSVRDAEVIAAADERGMAMIFTGVRHFRH